MENKNIKVDYRESQVREVISVQVLPNCSAGLDSDNAVVLSNMSELLGIEKTEGATYGAYPPRKYTRLGAFTREESFKNM